MTDKIVKGDIVVKRNGKMPIRVTDVYTTTLYGVYVHSNKSINTRISNVKLYEPNDGQTGGKNLSNKLYQTKDGEFGVALAINSVGHLVLEMKKTGEVKSFDPTLLELVMPFTVVVRYDNGAETHYISKEGDLEVGDIVLVDGGKGFKIGTVTKTNTKSDLARARLKGVKLITKPLGQDL